MKTRIKRHGCCILILLLTLVFSSCDDVGGFFAGDTTTDHPRNYVYKAGETINFYDERNNRNHIGSLTVWSMHILSEEEFILRERHGINDQGEPIYKNTVYQQIVQINYTYIGKTLSERRFWIYDSGRGLGKNSPDVAYEKVSEQDMESIVVALPNRSSTVKVEIMYTGVITPNAIVELSVNDNAATLDLPNNNQNESQNEVDENESQDETDEDVGKDEFNRLEEQLELIQSQIEKLNDNEQEIDLLKYQLNETQNSIKLYRSILILLVFVILGISIAFIILRIMDRKRRNL